MHIDETRLRAHFEALAAIGATPQGGVHRPALSFIAEIGGDIVGFLLGDIRVTEYGTDLRGWIDMIGISPDHQRLGIGRKLVEAFCEECQKNGVRPKRRQTGRLAWTNVLQPNATS